MNTNIKFFDKSDGWLFTILLYFRNRSKLKIISIIRTGNFLNHAILSLEEINQGLSRFVSEGMVEIKNQRLYWLPKGKQIKKDNHKKFSYL